MTATLKCKADFGRRPSKAPESSTTERPVQISRAARLLALAYYIERLIESGELKNYSEAAKKLGISRARISQICGLRWLPPNMQVQILVGEVAGHHVSEW